jgi:hypothetical protein
MPRTSAIKKPKGIVLPARDGARVGSIYISGPMRGYKELNFPAFYKAEEILRSIGVTVPIVNPAREDEEAGFDSSVSFREVIVIDLMMMAEKRSGLILIEGWEPSEGVAFELEAAKYMGTPAITFEHAILSGAEYVNNLFGANQ